MTSRDGTPRSGSHAELLELAMAGRLSRRDVFLRGIALGLSASAVAGAVAAVGGITVAGAQESPLAGKQIDMAILGIGGWPPSKLGVDMATELFSTYARDKYGYEVSFTFEEAPFGELFQKAAASFATREAEFNIVISDSQWLGAFAEPGWIVQLNDIIAENPELNVEFEPVAHDAYMTYPYQSDQLWGFPQEGDTQALFVRTDLFSNPQEMEAFRTQHGFELPQTFEEWEQLDMDNFEKIAAFFTRPDQELWGTALLNSKVYDFVSTYSYPFMYSTGGEIIEGDVGSYKVEGVLDSEINAQALARVKSFLAYQPEGAVNYDIDQAVAVFTSDRIATCFQWAAIGQFMITDANRDRVMVVPPPGFKQADGSLKRVYSIGGQPWVINAFNDEDHLQVAIDFMKWWYLDETQLEFAKRGGDPATTSLVNSPDFESLQPWFRAYKYMLQEGRSRDFWHDPKYSEMLAAQQEAFSAYLTDQISDPMQALRYAACQQQKILHDAGRTSIAPSDACSDVSL